VLRALYGEAALPASIRYSFGRSTTESDVDRAATVTARVVAQLRGGPVTAPAPA
jgi:cysteine sulfinate desulfinase/cysteine desulfurase-like protein